MQVKELGSITPARTLTRSDYKGHACDLCFFSTLELNRSLILFLLFSFIIRDRIKTKQNKTFLGSNFLANRVYEANETDIHTQTYIVILIPEKVNDMTRWMF